MRSPVYTHEGTYVASTVENALLFSHIYSPHSNERLEQGEPPVCEGLAVLDHHVVRLTCQLSRRVDAKPKRPLPSNDWDLPLLRVEWNAVHG